MSGLVNGLQNRLRRFESARHLKKTAGISSLMGFHFSKRKVGRVIDRAGLEIRYTLMGIGGLNPSPSAKRKKGNRRNGFLLLLLSIRIFLNKPFGN